MTGPRDGPPDSLCAALNRAAYWCPDCAGAVYQIHWCADRARWRVEIVHAPTCVVPRNSRLRRAVDDYLRDLINVSYPLADYGDPDIIGRHGTAGR